MAAFGRRGNPTEAAPDATFEFGAETGVAVKDPDPKNPAFRRSAQIAAVTLLVVAMGAAVYWADRLKAPSTLPSGSLRIETDSPGAEVRVDGRLKGTTPLLLTMPAGRHLVVVQSGANSKQLPVDISTGAMTVYHITWGDPPAAAPAALGSLTVTTDGAGGQVNIDGEDRGAAPLTIKNLTPGQHKVVVKSGGATYTRTVQIEAGATASLVIGGGGSTTPAAGWVSVSSPVAVQVFEGQRLIGTSDVERIMLPGGDHDLELVAEAIGYRASRKVRVSANQTATLALEMPKTAVSINAVPWADVTVDGTRLGETPLGNVSIALGPHEIVFRHPQLGERRLTAMVTLKDANRVSIDMRSR